MNGTALNWLSAAALVAALFALLHLVEQPAGQHVDPEEDRLHRAAHDLCTSELGPGAQVLWTLEGDLVCRPATLTAEAQP
jgi:hypothetical protein